MSLLGKGARSCRRRRSARRRRSSQKEIGGGPAQSSSRIRPAARLRLTRAKRTKSTNAPVGHAYPAARAGRVGGGRARAGFGARLARADGWRERLTRIDIKFSGSGLVSLARLPNCSKVRQPLRGGFTLVAVPQSFHLIEHPIDGVCSFGPRPVSETSFIASNRSRRAFAAGCMREASSRARYCSSSCALKPKKSGVH